MSTSIKQTKIKGLLLIERPVYRDERGFFHEIYRQSELKEASGIDFKPVQMNHSKSLPRVIRGIHTEHWNKLVYPVNGECFLPIVDLRIESPTFGKLEEFTIDNTSASSKQMALFIPSGFGNSICATGEKEVDYMYLVDEYWDDSKASGITWDDPDLKINWPIKNPIISERDRGNPKLREVFPEKFKEE